MILTEKEQQYNSRRVCVYGPAKSGKTLLVGKLAEAGYSLIYFDLENGVKTLSQHLSQQAKSRVNVISLPDTKVYPIAIETMLKVITGMPVSICVKHGKVNCPLCKKEPDALFESVELNALAGQEKTIVVFDSLTQLAISAINFITKAQDDDYKYEWDDYRRQGTLMDKFLSQCQQAKYNLIAITHEVIADIPDGTQKIVPVAGTTNFSRNTAKYFDDVVYCELKNRQHAVGSGTGYKSDVLTGSRSGIKLEEIKEPTEAGRLVALFSESRETQTSQQVAAAAKTLNKIQWNQK